MTAIDTLSRAGLTEVGTTPKTANQGDASERFLKMLVAQMQNQDPLNPLDNAQVTSQMAQINTVSGLDKVNQSIQSLGPQILQLKAVQGAALVGRGIATPGNRVLVEDGSGRGGFQLGAKAAAVTVEVLSAGGQVLAKKELGGLDAGRHDFELPLSGHEDGENLVFRVTAMSGAQAVGSQSLMFDRVSSVTTNAAGELQLTLQHGGSMSADAVTSFN